MKKKTICLTFICRDNKTVIGQMIDSCFPFIDEIVACDTGSTDKTTEKILIASKDKPLTVNRHKWKNFGHNRTLMMQEAAKSKCDYILVMDSDETITVINNAFQGKLESDIIMIKTVSGNMEYYRDRMFKNSHDWKWIGYAHEYPHSNTFSTKYESDELQLTLYPKKNNKHIKRNYDLLLQEELDGFATSRTYFYIAQSARDLGMQGIAIEYYKKCIESSVWNEERFMAFYDTGRIYHNMKEYDNAKKYYLDAYKELPERIESLYNLSVVLREQGEHHEALIYLSFIKDKPMPKSGLFLEYAIYDYLIDFEMSINLYWTDDISGAIIYSKKVSHRCTNNPSVFEQNNKNISYSRRKLIEKGNTHTLVIEPPEGYDGLGDHLFFSHLPELAKKKGFSKILISNSCTYKTIGTPNAVWKSNPFVDGFTNERGTYFDDESIIGILSGNPLVKDMPMLKQIAMAYGLYHDDYNGLPILYMNGRKSVFENIEKLIRLERKKSRESGNKHLFYDGNWKHHIGVEQKDVDDFFSINWEIYYREYPVKYQAENMGKCLEVNNILGMEVWENGSLETYILRIIACHRFICLMSGGSVVSAALGKPCIVIDNDQSNKYYKFPQINKYLSDAKTI